MRKTYILLLPIIASVIIVGCQSQQSEMQPAESPPAPQAGVVEVTANGLSFEAPDSIPSGWVTFRFTNKADVTHFMVLEHTPDGIGVAEHQEQVAPVFQRGMDFLNAEEPDSANAEFGKLPEWFAKTKITGGIGLTAPGHTSQTTVHLVPGNYLVECYVKTDGNFHSYNANPGKYGMVHHFTVTADSSGMDAPVADLNLTLSSDRGIEVDSVVTAGKHTVAVHFEDQKLYENFLGHDVHLARLKDDTDLKQLATWMDWTQRTGFEDPPSVDFLGGAQEMTAGNTEYFTVTLEPGRYAWISEITKPDERGFLKTFTVSGT